MESSIPAIVFGGMLIVTAAVMIGGHRRAWRKRLEEKSLEQSDREHYFRQYRRRMQTSAMLGLVGLLIVVGDWLIPWNQAAVWFPIYWGVVLMLTGWIGLLGVADLLSTRVYTNAALARVRSKQRELESQLAAVRRAQSNGADHLDSHQ